MSQQGNEAAAVGSEAGGVRAVPDGRGFGICEALTQSGGSFFEPGTYIPDGGFVFVRNPSAEELVASYQLLVSEVGGVAPFPRVEAVVARNPLAWWVIFRSADGRRENAGATGLCAYLPLNAQGFEALKRGALDARDPALELVARSGEEPVALYLWAIVAHGLSDIAGKLVGHAIGLDLYERLPMFGTIGTEAGLAALRRSTKSASDAAALKIGSVFEIRLPPKHLEHQRAMPIWEGRRDPPRRSPGSGSAVPDAIRGGASASEAGGVSLARSADRPLADQNSEVGNQKSEESHSDCRFSNSGFRAQSALRGSAPPRESDGTSIESDGERTSTEVVGRPTSRKRHHLKAHVAQTADDIAKIFALRAAVFMAEQDCPYEEEFDGNDFSGTQLLGLVDGAPAATLRIRYFADFVKIERLAVLPRYRRTPIAREIVEFGIGLVRRKGYTRMYGHAQTHLVNFWRKFGFEPTGRNTPFSFSGRDYVEIAGSLAAHEERLTMHCDPFVLIRPEGRWDEAGVLERGGGTQTMKLW